MNDREYRTYGPGPSCQTPGCSTGCSYAYSCHEQRVGRSAGYWPGIALILFVGLSTLGAWLI
jgi:hypothetical protein